DGGGDPRETVSVEQRFADASDLFEGHLAGLVKAFQLLQQQSYELLQENPKTSCCSVKVLPREIVELPKVPMSRVLSPRNGTSEDDAMDLSVKSVKKVWSEDEERPIHDQFERLKDPRTPFVSVETLLEVLHHFHPDPELIDLNGLIGHLVLGTNSKMTADPADEGEEHHEHHHHHHHYRLKRRGTGVIKNNNMSGEILSIKLDFTAFLRLRADEQLWGSSSHVRRDAAKLRHALHAEALQALYMDEPKAVEDGDSYYVLSPCTQRCLEFIPAVVIILNSFSFGLEEVYTNEVFWEWVENVFMAFYLGEAAAKLWLMGCRGYFRGPEWAWNLFDIFCLLTSLVDFTVTQVVNAMGEGNTLDLGSLMLLKMLRLARLARLIRALRYPIFRELNLMVMGVVSGIRVLVWAIVLLLVFVYALGVALFRLIAEDPELPEFGTLTESMLTLFRCFTDGCTAYDGTPLQERMMRKYPQSFFVGYILVFMLVTVGIFNLIMAIFIDNVMTNQLERKQRDLSETADDTEVAIMEHLCRLLLASKSQLIPADVAEEMKSIEAANLSQKARVRAQFECVSSADVVISRDAFRVWLTDPDFLRVLEGADVDIHNKTMLFDLMDADMGGSLSANEVFFGLMKLRGPPTKGDIIGISLRVTHIAQLVQEWSTKAR
ncbi:Voltage-dependent L-type calcium channel subunit alpha-1F (Voltage-gated calcium channel subunit alpha Cav1.4), partial [Durusdinium trenchii]